MWGSDSVWGGESRSVLHVGHQQFRRVLSLAHVLRQVRLLRAGLPTWGNLHLWSIVFMSVANCGILQVILKALLEWENIMKPWILSFHFPVWRNASAPKRFSIAAGGLGELPGYKWTGVSSMS